MPMKSILARQHVNQIFANPASSVYYLNSDSFLMKAPDGPIFGKRPNSNNNCNGHPPLLLELVMFHSGKCRIYKRKSSLEKSITQPREKADEKTEQLGCLWHRRNGS